MRRRGNRSHPFGTIVCRTGEIEPQSHQDTKRSRDKSIDTTPNQESVDIDGRPGGSSNGSRSISASCELIPFVSLCLRGSFLISFVLIGYSSRYQLFFPQNLALGAHDDLFHRHRSSGHLHAASYYHRESATAWDLHDHNRDALY